MLIPRLDVSIHLLQSRSLTENTRSFTYLFLVYSTKLSITHMTSC